MRTLTQNRSRTAYKLWICAGAVINNELCTGRALSDDTPGCIPTIINGTTYNLRQHQHVFVPAYGANGGSYRWWSPPLYKTESITFLEGKIIDEPQQRRNLPFVALFHSRCCAAGWAGAKVTEQSSSVKSLIRPLRCRLPVAGNPSAVPYEPGFFPKTIRIRCRVLHRRRTKLIAHQTRPHFCFERWPATIQAKAHRYGLARGSHPTAK